MSILREIIGLALVVLAWINPLGLDTGFRIVLFVLGFDVISFIIKLLVFGIDFFLGLGVGWVLFF